MKAIVTGATGGLGRNLVAELRYQGWQVLAFGRNQEIGRQLGVEFHSFDLADAEQTTRHFQHADVVFHCAALSSPWGRYNDFFRANVQATQNVLDAMTRLDIPKIVHISTPSVYFDFQDRLNVTEGFLPLRFVNHYAHTKYQAEQRVLASAVASVILRPRAIFGEYDTVLVPRLEQVAAWGHLPLVRGGEPWVDVCYVGNLVYAMQLAATQCLPKGSVFNITNQQPLQIRQLFELVLQTLGLSVPLRAVSLTRLMMQARVLECLARLGVFREPPLTRYGAGVISYSQTLDSTRSRDILGYKPQYSIMEGLERYARHRNI